MFSARQLRCVRQDRVLFEAVDIQLMAGELLQVAGKNGAGKSSLLRILAGLTEPDEGSLLWRGQRLADSGFAEDLCFIGHQSGVQGQLTALEHLEFWQATFNLQIQDPFQTLAKLGLAGLEDIPCQMLSAGQQRRVSLARLWLTKRPIWILDEPLTALDQGAITFLQQRFAEHLAAQGMIILTTHQPLQHAFPQMKTLELKYRW